MLHLQGAILRCAARTEALHGVTVTVTPSARVWATLAQAAAFTIQVAGSGRRGCLQPTPFGRQLERLLRSEGFSQAARHRRLLPYLVERALAGEADRLKEYAVAIDVFESARHL